MGYVSHILQPKNLPSTLLQLCYHTYSSLDIRTYSNFNFRTYSGTPIRLRPGLRNTYHIAFVLDMTKNVGSAPHGLLSGPNVYGKSNAWELNVIFRKKGFSS